MSETRQMKRASQRQMKKDLLKGANAANLIQTIRTMAQGIDNLNLKFVALFDLLKERGILSDDDIKVKIDELIKLKGVA